MRNISLIVFSFFLISLVSCSKKDSGGSTTPVATITSLSISVDRSTIVADGFDEATFTVRDQNNVDVTSVTLIELNGYVFAGNKIVYQIGEPAGTFQVKATKGSIVSNTISLTVVAAVASKYTTKIVAEDCTGAWCGWCPRIAHKFDGFMAANNKIFTVGIHNNDALAISSVESALRAKFGISSFPSAIINRNRKFNDNSNINSLADSTDLSVFLKERAPLGLAINSSISGSTLNITTKVGFDANINKNLRLVVYVVQDGIVLAQTNYYANNNSYPGNPYFSAGSTITGFVHNSVLRSVPTTINGEIIPLSSQVRNGEYSANHTVALSSGWNAANLKVLSFVVYDDNQTKKGIANAQWVAAGSNKNYD